MSIATHDDEPQPFSGTKNEHIGLDCVDGHQRVRPLIESRTFSLTLSQIRRLLTSLTAALCLVVLLCIEPAFASGNHNYSTAYETTSGTFTGVSVTRKDITGISNQPFDGCGTVFSGSPIYQTQWTQGSDAGDWLELGTAHQCANTWQYRYWGYGQGGNWYPLGTNDVGGGATHTFRITRANSSSIWNFEVDSNVKATFYWKRSFANLSAGLESYAPNAAATPHSYYDLELQRLAASTWTDWTGRDSTPLDDPPMCGIWNNDHSWHAGEAASC